MGLDFGFVLEGIRISHDHYGWRFECAIFLWERDPGLCLEKEWIYCSEGEEIPTNRNQKGMVYEIISFFFNINGLIFQIVKKCISIISNPLNILRWHEVYQLEPQSSINFFKCVYFLFRIFSCFSCSEEFLFFVFFFKILWFSIFSPVQLLTYTTIEDKLHPVEFVLNYLCQSAQEVQELRRNPQRISHLIKGDVDAILQVCTANLIKFTHKQICKKCVK